MQSSTCRDAYLEEAWLRLAAEKNLYEFTKQAWHIIEGVPFVDSWAVQAICEHIQAAFNRDILRLLINGPPRIGKTIPLNIMLPAWGWLSNPSEKFMYVSYGSDLSNENSRRCRQVLQSDWYKIRWGDRYRIVSDQNAKERFDNDKNGYRMATSINASSTGFGANCLILDDANNAKEAESDTAMEKTNAIVSSAFFTRLNNLQRDIIIVNAQRLGEKDLSNYVIANDIDNEWTKLILPMEFEKSRKCRTKIKGRVWEDPRTQEGEVICPVRFPPSSLKRLKSALGSQYRIAAQLQQRPSPQEGGLLKRDWFCWWKEPKPPEIIQVIQSWDTAFLESKSEDGAYSACTTWGLFHDKNKIINLILLGLFRGKIEFPELLERAKFLYNDWRDTGEKSIIADGAHKSDIVLIEAKASGLSLIQTLRKMAIPATSVNPGKYDKETRVKLVSHFIQGGRVWVPARGPEFIKLKSFSETLVECAALFPAGGTTDVIDSMSQVLHRLKSDSLLTHPKDEDFDEPYTKTKSHGYW